MVGSTHASRSAVGIGAIFAGNLSYYFHGSTAMPDLIVRAVAQPCAGAEKAIAMAAPAGIDVLLNPSSFCKFDMATYANVVAFPTQGKLP